MTTSEQFFVDSRSDFFAPLSGKYREIRANCIKNLYLRLNGPEADYTYNLNRQDILDIFLQSIRENPLVLSTIEDESGTEDDVEFIENTVSDLNHPKLARDTYNKLKSCGWIEEYMDPGVMETAVRFTPYGRQFAVPFAQQHNEIITNTQHTRSTLSHLNSFIGNLERNLISVSDLMIATKLAYEIVSDFNELIEALVEKRRELMASVNMEIQEAKKAGESFFEFMENRFMPDIRFRFSADSVERYRHDIITALGKIRSTKKEAKIAIEKELRQAHPTLISPDRPVILYWALDQIEHHVSMACEIKLPELRAETENFVRRAQALITHIASLSLGSSDSESIFSIAARLAELSENELEYVFDQPCSRFALLQMSLYNPGKILPPLLSKKEQVDTTFDDVHVMDAEARRMAYIRYQLERVFAVETGKITDFVIQQLAGGHRVKSSHLPITNANSLLAVLHAPQLASVSGGEKPRFRIVVGDPVKNDFFYGDGFELEYRPPDLDHTDIQ